MPCTQQYQILNLKSYKSQSSRDLNIIYSAHQVMTQYIEQFVGSRDLKHNILSPPSIDAVYRTLCWQVRVETHCQLPI